MADVYIVYSSRDDAAPQAASRLASLLSPQWEVWWDDHIVGDFAQAIEKQLALARCVIPIWSSGARASESVRDELDLAKELGVPILPVRIEDCKAPYRYGQLTTVDLREWNGEPDYPGYKQLLRKLSEIVPPKAKPTRLLGIAGGSLRLPATFFSVSSYETRLSPADAVKALRVFGARTVLVSAYDLLPERREDDLVQELFRLREQGAYVIVDSGNYEADRRKDETWTATDFRAALAGVSYDHVFCFDIMRPSLDKEKVIEEIVNAVSDDRDAIGEDVSPIVHAPVSSEGTRDPGSLAEMVYHVADRLRPVFVAVPERELGPGLFASAKTVRQIRTRLDALPFYQPLHLLGTGNPWTIAIMAAAGADTFDGLEWCRVVADGRTNLLYHFRLFDFFKYQDRLSSSPVTAQAVDDDEIDYAGKVAFHNLDILSNFNEQLHKFASRRQFEALVRELLGQENARELTEAVPELFE